MRIVIYDGILETHVADSLALALARRGHDVLNTGRFGSGFRFPTDPKALRRIDSEVERAIEFEPDLVVVMRPASLPPAALQRLRPHVQHLYAWFCDDPVLFDLSYGAIVDDYDLVLHCGTDAVLDFYTERFGRATGVNFPFWTDPSFFPRVYGDAEPESDLLFLGNAQGELRRKRYHDLSKLTHRVRIHGRSGTDFRGVNGGYLDSDAEVVTAGAAARAAINIPQYFSDHEGQETWFDGLGALGHFQYPSRVIQYGAMGLPVFNVGVSRADQRTFPELISIDSVQAIDAAMDELDDARLSDLSRRTHDRFLRSFSADSRAMALEALVADDSWRGLSVEDRTDWFSQFDALEVPPRSITDDGPRIAGQTSIGQRVPFDHDPLAAEALDIAVIRDPAIWSEAARLASVLRALARLGHRIDWVEREDAVHLGALTAGDAAPQLHPTALWRQGRRFDLVIVATEARPLVDRDLLPSSARVVWCDEFESAPAAGDDAGFDIVLHTNDLGGVTAPGMYLPPVLDVELLRALDATTAAPRGNRDDSWYFGAGDEASPHHYPEVAEEATLFLGAKLEPSRRFASVADVARATVARRGAILLPRRRPQRATLHPLFGPMLAAGVPVLSGRIDGIDLPGIGGAWSQVRDAGETVRKAQRSSPAARPSSQLPIVPAASLAEQILRACGLPSDIAERDVLPSVMLDGPDDLRTIRLEARDLRRGMLLELVPRGLGARGPVRVAGAAGAVVAPQPGPGCVCLVLVVTAPSVTLIVDSAASEVAVRPIDRPLGSPDRPGS